MSSEAMDSLSEKLLTRQVSRREFVQRATILGASATSIASLLAACGGGTASPKGPKKTITMTFATAVASGSTYPEAAYSVFRDEVAKRTDGQVVVNLSCCNALGTEDQFLKLMTAGSLEVAAVTTGLVVPTVPEFAIPGMPFIFRDPAHANKALAGKLGSDLGKALLDKAQVRSLGFMEIGTNYFLNSRRAINSLDDLKGMKVRLAPDPVQVAAWKLLGTTPITLGWNEVYTSLQTKVIDGLEATINGLYDAKFYEQAKYLNLMGNYFRAAVFAISEKFYSAQSADIQKAIRDAATIANSKEVTKIEAQNDSLIPDYKAKGVTVTTPNVSAARQIMKPVYDQFASVVTPQVLAEIDAVK